MLICADWLISALTCDPHLRASGTMLRPPGAPALAPSRAALIAQATVWAADGSTSVSSQTPWMAQARRPETAMRDVLAHLLPELALPAAEPSS